MQILFMWADRNINTQITEPQCHKKVCIVNQPFSSARADTTCWGPETDQTLYQDDWRTCHYICLTYGKMQSFGLWSPIKYPREGCKPKIHLSWILRVLLTYWHTVAEMHCRWDIQAVIILILLSRNVLCILFVSQNIVQSRLFHLKSTLTSK